MSRLAFITDIHGNEAALLASLKDIESQRCDGIYCLGDLVDGGNEDEQVVREIMRRGIPTVRGNHDEILAVPLPEECAQFLTRLPETIVFGDCLLTHISPRSEQKKDKIRDTIEAWNVFNECPYRRIFIGHVHYPLLFGEKARSSIEAREYPIVYQRPIRLDRDDRYIICAGVLGYSRDRFDKPRYSIYDDVASTIEFRHVDAPLLDLDKKRSIIFDLDQLGGPGTLR